MLASGSAAAAALIGGGVDIASSNMFTAVQARAKGVPFLVVAPGGRFDPANPTSQLLVPIDSTIKSGKDLEGRTIAVAGLNDMSSLSVRAWVTETGGDPAKVHYLEAPMSTMLPLVQEHHVDAIFVSSPALQNAMSSGAVKRLAVPYTTIGKHFFTSVWVAMAPWVDTHRDLALKFAEIHRRATIYTNSHWNDVLPLVSSYTKIPLETLRGMRGNTGATSVVPEDIQPMIDIAAKYHVIPSAFSAKEMIMPGTL
jgi:NitT/TauT family transport system substrate-binding protein